MHSHCIVLPPDLAYASTITFLIFLQNKQDNPRCAINKTHSLEWLFKLKIQQNSIIYNNYCRVHIQNMQTKIQPYAADQPNNKIFPSTFRSKIFWKYNHVQLPFDETAIQPTITRSTWILSSTSTGSLNSSTPLKHSTASNKMKSVPDQTSSSCQFFTKYCQLCK